MTKLSFYRFWPSLSGGGGKKETNFLAGFKMRGTTSFTTTNQRTTKMVRVENQLKKSIRAAIRCTRQANSASECVFFWEAVDELTKAGHDQRRRVHVERLEPLNSFCTENPSEPECKAFDL